MSNIHNIFENSHSQKAYNPYYNEGYGYNPASNNDTESQTKVNFSANSCKTMLKSATKQFSFWILVLELLYFIIENILFKTKYNSWNCVLLDLGAKYKPKIQNNFEFHRLILPIILHADLMHFTMNAVSQFFLNFFLEKNYGTKKTATVFILSGIGGNLFSCIMFQENISVGASSSIFGMLALYGGFLLTDTAWDRKNLKLNLFVYVIIVFSNFYFLLSPNSETPTLIDIGAHLGFFFYFIFLNNCLFNRRIYCWCVISSALLLYNETG